MAVRDVASLLVGLLVLCHTGGAWANVVVSMEDRVEVLRGGTAQITCMFNSTEGIGGFSIEWFYVTRSGEKQLLYYRDSTMSLVERDTPFTDRISVNGTGATGGIVLTINNVLLEDELEYICHIKTVVGDVDEGRTKLKVFEIPDIPVIEGVQTGISVNENGLSKIATCEVKNGFPKPNITWYRNNTPLRNVPNVVNIVPSTTTESTGLFSVKSELNMKVMKEDKDDLFYCEVNYFVPGETRMTESNRINITVYYPSDAVSVWVESPKGKIKEGDLIELHCRGNGNAPSALISIVHKETDESWETNRLELRNVTRLNSGVYECTSVDMDDFNFEEVSGTTTVMVNYLDSPAVIPEYPMVMLQGELNITCNALSSLQTQTTWFKNGKEVSKGHMLMLKDVTFDAAGTYMCVVTVTEIEGMETSKMAVVRVKGAPEIVKPDTTEIEANSESTVDLSCDVRGFPIPTVTWTTSDGKVLQTTSEKENEEGIQSVVRIEVTSDITALCSATNSYGTDELAFNIKATIHTTTPATTTTTTIATTTTATSSSSTTISSSTVKAETAIPPKKIKKEGRGVIIAVIIICILLLAILGSVLYFLYKKGKICGRSGKKDLTKEKSNKDNIVVEMKSDNLEDAELLGVNGEKQPQSDQ